MEDLRLVYFRHRTVTINALLMPHLLPHQALIQINAMDVPF